MNHLYNYNQIVLFGDSLTQNGHNAFEKGWCAALQHTYIRKLDVLNRGFSGYNTEMAIHLLPHLLPKKDNSIKNPRIFLLTIFFGANDAAIPSSNQHVSLEKYKENIKRMIDIIKNPDSPHYSLETRILLIAPPPLDEAAWEKHKGICDRKSEITAKYAQTCVDLANESNVPVLNLWKLITDKVTSSSSENNHVTLNDFLTDGLHLSALGNETLFSGLLEIILENWPELDPENLKPLTPLWTEMINPDQQFKSLESNIISQLHI